MLPAFPLALADLTEGREVSLSLFSSGQTRKCVLTPPPRGFLVIDRNDGDLGWRERFRIHRPASHWGDLTVGDTQKHLVSTGYFSIYFPLLFN